MARKLRVWYKGAIYHIMCRGNHRNDIFRDGEDYQVYLTIDEINKFGFIGELSLNGQLRPCSGILPMAIEAKKRGINNLIVPIDNLEEASLVSYIKYMPLKLLYRL